MIDIDIQISISERSSGWATNYHECDGGLRHADSSTVASSDHVLFQFVGALKIVTITSTKVLLL